MIISSSAVNAVGMVAAVCTTISLVPQLLRIWRLKTARDISLYMFLLFSFGVSLWLFYGYEIHSLPVLLANLFTLIFSLAILGLKLRYDRRARIEDRQGASAARQ
jgi:MtN3 and saliva related transmembrane protein